MVAVRAVSLYPSKNPRLARQLSLKD